MNRALAVSINYMVGSMMLEFTRHMGPIPRDGNTKLTQTYAAMEKIRKEISLCLIDHIDAEEEGPPE
jgi:hypothetical protein